MSRIVAYGDSFTVGQGLNPNDPCPEIPDENSWPYLLGNSHSIPASNRAGIGIGNKTIWHVICNAEHKEDDIVIICWSFPARFAVVTDEYDYTIYPESKTLDDSSVNLFRCDMHTIGPWHEDDYVLNFYENLHTDNNSYIDTLLYMNHADMYLKSLGIKHVIHTGVPLVPQFELISEVPIRGKNTQYDTYCLPHWNKIKMPFTMTGALLKFGEAPDGHLSLKAHKYFATQLLTILPF